MAATNPLRVSDLIKKYGWTIMPYLSNLGVRNLAEAQVLFVDSEHADTLDADDGEHGHSFTKPLATWDYAVGLLTADEGGIILMAPGHNENIAANETIDNDVNGIAVIGLGTGTLRPRFDFDDASSTIDIGGNNVTFVNLTFRPGEADVLIGVDVETGKTNFRMVDCEFLEGEAGTDEFLAAVELKASCHDAVIENNIFRAGWSSHPDDGISLKGASNNVTIRNNRFSGPYGNGAGVTAAISNSSGVCLDLLIENNVMKVEDGQSGIEVISTTPAVIRKNLIISTGLAVDSMIVGTIAELDQNVGITSDGTSGEFIKGGTISPEVVQYNLDHLAKTDTGVVADADISGIVVDGSILGHIMSTDADPANFNASTDSLQSLATAIAAIDNTTNLNTAVSDTPTAKSLHDILSELDGANTYDNTTDSLEAISNLLRTGTAVLNGINLDHLMKTAVSDEQNMTEVANGSALAHILVKGAAGAITDFDPTTDSLEAIADAVTGFTTAVSTTPTARSVQDILEKDGSGNFTAADDSLEAISDFVRTGTTLGAGINLDHLMKTAVGNKQDMSTEVTNTSVLSHIMTKTDGDVNDFDPTTDSLEAIRDNQQTAARAAIDDAELDHLLELDGATNPYPEQCANDSIIAKILCKGDPATINTYDCQTDSLEAISDLLRTGTTVLAGLNLDHLCLTTTGVAADGELDQHVIASTILGHIMATDADPSNYNASTDSLQSIAASITAGTTFGAGVNLDHLMKTAVVDEQNMAAEIANGTALAHILVKGAGGGTTDFDPTTDSLEAIADSITAGTNFGAGINLDHFMLTAVVDEQDMGAEIANGSALAHILVKAAGGDVNDFDPTTDSLEAISDKVTAVDTVVDMGRQTLKVAGTVLTGGDVDVFTVGTGPVKITSLFCIMVAATDAASKMGFSCTPTAGAETDLTPTVGNGVELNGAADAGDIIYSELDNTIMIIADTDGTAVPKVPEYSQIVPIGSINLVMENAAPTTGSVDVYVQWEPLAPGATLTAT